MLIISIAIFYSMAFDRCLIKDYLLTYLTSERQKDRRTNGELMI